jgi:hypothetical protein
MLSSCFLLSLSRYSSIPMTIIWTKRKASDAKFNVDVKRQLRPFWDENIPLLEHYKPDIYRNTAKPSTVITRIERQWIVAIEWANLHFNAQFRSQPPVAPISRQKSHLLMITSKTSTAHPRTLQQWLYLHRTKVSGGDNRAIRLDSSRTITTSNLIWSWRGEKHDSLYCLYIMNMFDSTKTGKKRPISLKFTRKQEGIIATAKQAFIGPKSSF